MFEYFDIAFWVYFVYTIMNGSFEHNTIQKASISTFMILINFLLSILKWENTKTTQEKDMRICFSATKRKHSCEAFSLSPQLLCYFIWFLNNFFLLFLFFSYCFKLLFTCRLLHSLSTILLCLSFFSTLTTFCSFSVSSC